MSERKLPEQLREQQEQQDHDANYKLMFGDPVMVREFLEDFGPPEIVRTLDFNTLERLPVEYVDEKTRKKRKGDSAWRVGLKGGGFCFVAILLEFQSRPDPLMALRILVYSGLMLQILSKTEETKAHGLPPLLPIVIYNGSDEWHVAEDVADLFAPMHSALESFNPRQRYLPVKVMALPEEALQGGGIAAQVFRMERLRDLEQLDGLVQETIRRFSGEKYADIRRLVAGWLRDVLSVRFKVPADAIKGMETLQGVHSMLAHHVDLWKAECIQTGLAEGLAQGKAEGLALGEARGIQIGAAQGEAQMARRLAADALVARFSVAPAQTRDALAAIDDPEVLRRLVRDAWQAKSLEDFIALLPDGKHN